MWEQRESLKFRMFGDRGVDHRHQTSTSSGSTNGKGGSSSSSSSSKGGSSSSGGGSSNGAKDKKGGNFVSRLGFKFDVANYDINAISPTSW